VEYRTRRMVSVISFGVGDRRRLGHRGRCRQPSCTPRPDGQVAGIHEEREQAHLGEAPGPEGSGNGRAVPDSLINSFPFVTRGMCKLLTECF
jgi:hypothetical protein